MSYLRTEEPRVVLVERGIILPLKTEGELSIPAGGGTVSSAGPGEGRKAEEIVPTGPASVWYPTKNRRETISRRKITN